MVFIFFSFSSRPDRALSFIARETSSPDPTGGGLLLSVDQQHSFISTLFLVHPTISENQLSKRKKKRCDQDWDRIFERDEKTERYGWSMR
ncbi:hypothetical protein F8388_000122 [Cannabis sativa]|uniref:Uncharacterized protein n=1 Tax=Cannabis sativa TaxID=3483 RepID=A0A7J6FMT2_CANSA|nr:hypothetical protein F8388_000122 [Cannabis sativa]